MMPFAQLLAVMRSVFRARDQRNAGLLAQQLDALRAANQACDYGQAVQLSTSILEHADANQHRARAEAFVSRARARMYGEKAFRLALADADAALAIDPASPAAWELRGIAQYRTGYYWTAAESFEKCSALAPTARIHVWRAAAYFNYNNLKPALAAAGEALRCDPEYGSALEWRGMVRWKTGERKMAIEDCTRALRHADPEKRKALHLTRGEWLQQLGRIAEALEDCDACLELDPNEHEARALRVALRERSGDVEGALEDCGCLIASNPRNLQAWRARVRLLGIKGRAEEALAAVDSVSGTFPDSAEAHALLALAFRQAGMPEPGLACIQRALQLAPGQSSLETERVRLLAEAGETQVALDLASAAIKTSPWDGELRASRGEIHLKKGDAWAAIADFDRALRCWEQMCSVNGDPGLQADYFHTALAAFTGRARAHVALGKYYLALGDARHALKLFPGDPAVLGIQQQAREHIPAPGQA